MLARARNASDNAIKSYIKFKQCHFKSVLCSTHLFKRTLDNNICLFNYLFSEILNGEGKLISLILLICRAYSTQNDFHCFGNRYIRSN